MQSKQLMNFATNKPHNILISDFIILVNESRFLSFVVQQTHNVSLTGGLLIKNILTLVKLHLLLHIYQIFFKLV